MGSGHENMAAAFYMKHGPPADRNVYPCVSPDKPLRNDSICRNRKKLHDENRRDYLLEKEINPQHLYILKIGQVLEGFVSYR